MKLPRLLVPPTLLLACAGLVHGEPDRTSRSGRRKFRPFTTSAQFPERNRPRTEWRQNVLAQSFHAGDDLVKGMRNSKPDEVAYGALFSLPEDIKPEAETSVFISLSVSNVSAGVEKTRPNTGMAPWHFTRLFINGNEAAILNKLVKGRTSPAKITRLNVKVPGTFLVEGLNHLEIVPGQVQGNLADVEIHKVIVSSKPIVEN
jgi:hypothetical protein